MVIEGANVLQQVSCNHLVRNCIETQLDRASLTSEMFDHDTILFSLYHLHFLVRKKGISFSEIVSVSKLLNLSGVVGDPVGGVVRTYMYARDS